MTHDILAAPGTDHLIEVPLVAVEPRIKKGKPAGSLTLLTRILASDGHPVPPETFRDAPTA